MINLIKSQSEALNLSSDKISFSKKYHLTFSKSFCIIFLPLSLFLKRIDAFKRSNPEQKGQKSMWLELIKLIPSLLWFTLAVVLFIKFFRPIRYELFPKISGIKAMGIELSFITKSINAALEFAEKNPKWKVTIPSSAKENILKRAQNHLEVIKDARILWIDDVPENNINEWKMLLQLNAKIEIAKTTESALDMLKKNTYDLIISDMARNDEQDAGLKFLDKYRKDEKSVPVIFYIGIYDPKLGIPPGAFGITNRPDELLHLVFDALERKRY